MHGSFGDLSQSGKRNVVNDSLGASTRYKVIWLIAGLTCIRLLLGGMLGLTYDETYIAVMSQHLGWGYVDHPPAAMALSALAQALTGSTDNIVLRLPTIILFAATTWLIYRTGSILFGERAGWYGALLLSFMPMFSLYLGVHGLTDTPMLFCLAATALCLCHAVFDERPGWAPWIWAGVFAGLSMSAKYTAGLALLGFAIFFLTSPQHRKLLKTPEPYAAVAIALLILLPVLAWNAQHDWISFRFQGARIGPTGIAPWALLGYLGVQSICFLPGPWLLLVWSMVKAFRLGPNSARTWLLVCAGALPIVFFACLRLSPNPAKGYHWAASGYLLLCPLAGCLIENFFRSWPRLTRACTQIVIVTFAIVLSVVVIDVRTNWLWLAFPSLAHYDPLLNDSVDWSDLPATVARLKPAGTEPVVGVGLDWEECVKADWALRGKMQVLCLAPKPLQYPLLRPRSDFLGRDALIFSRRPPELIAQSIASYFESVHYLETIVLTDFGRPFSHLAIVRGIRYNGQSPWPREFQSDRR